MLAAALLICSMAFAETKTLALQICLDREACSCSTIDGVWGRMSERALAEYARRKAPGAAVPSTPDAAYDRFFASSGNLFRIETVTAADLAALVKVPESPAGKSALARLGYESIKEMFAERGHLSERALERMNPGVDWEHVKPGLRLVIPDFPTMESYLGSWSGQRPAKMPVADRVEVSLSNFEIRVFGKANECLAIFPCSIARDKAKLPPHGNLKIVNAIANPNYTYTPDYTPPGQRPRRYVLPEGPNSPIGVAWLGLNLPGYGIHGTPRPATIGNAESHGCFRLANWNAARLYAMCRSGTKVVIDP